MMDLEARIKAGIRDVPDFPKDGILFKDISTLLLQPALAGAILDGLAAQYADAGIDAIAGIESRGFLFGNALALRLQKPFVLIRKAGKLPAEKITRGTRWHLGAWCRGRGRGPAGAGCRCSGRRLQFSGRARLPGRPSAPGADPSRYPQPGCVLSTAPSRRRAIMSA